MVALEGLDAVGKTTAAAGLEKELIQIGIPVIVRHAERHYLRSEFRAARKRNDPLLKYLLQACAAKLLHDEIMAAPTESVFICDRYFTSARAYFVAVCGEPDLIDPRIPLLPDPDVPVLLECGAVIRKVRLMKLKHKPSLRKLRATNETFSDRMHHLMLPMYPWKIINTQRVSRRATVARLRDLVLEIL